MQLHFHIGLCTKTIETPNHYKHILEKKNGDKCILESIEIAKQSMTENGNKNACNFPTKKNA